MHSEDETSNASSFDEFSNVKLPVEVQMCRFCGRIGSDNSAALIRLHDPTEHHNVIKNIRREIIESWKVQFHPYDGLPQHICQSCFLAFDGYFSFRKNYLQSQNTLRTIYEDMKEKELQKSIRSRIEASPKHKITNDELHQRKMLHGITNDHNYLGNESNCDRYQYDEKLFSGSELFQVDKENEDEIEFANLIKEDIVESQSLFEGITEPAEENNENQTKPLLAHEQYYEETESEHSITEDTIESQTLFEDITDVELAQKNFENQTITSKRNEYEVKNLLRAHIPRIAHLAAFSSDNFENHLELDSTWKSKMQKHTSVSIEPSEGLQTDLVVSSKEDFENSRIIKSPINLKTNASQMEKIKNEINENDSDEQRNKLDSPIDRYSPIKSERTENQLNVTIFIQNKAMETQIKSDIEKQILNLVEIKSAKNFDNVHATKSPSKSETTECAVDTSFLKKEETTETQVQAMFENQIMKLTESSIDDLNDVVNKASNAADLDKSSTNKSILIEKVTVKTQLKAELDGLTTGSVKSEENDCKTDSTIPNERHKKKRFIKSRKNFSKKEKRKRNPYRLPFSCNFCVSDPDLLSKKVYDKYPTEDALEEHFRLQHDPELPYSCLICKKKFKQYTTCRRHVFYTHKKPNVVCEVCGGELPAVKISEHMERCHTINDYKCEICHKEFKNISLTKFKYHQKWHNQQQQLKCTFCNKSFVQQSHLQEHITEQHTKDYKIKCEICGEGFSAQFKKYVHMAKVHGELKPIKCLYCDQRFLGYKLRVRHMIAFHDHIHNKSDEQSICLICKKVFGNERGLSIHESMGCTGSTTYSENTSKSMHSCSICPRQFKSKATLTRHYKFHNKEGRPFQCELCSLNYETKLDLLNHKCVQFPDLSKGIIK